MYRSPPLYSFVSLWLTIQVLTTANVLLSKTLEGGKKSYSVFYGQLFQQQQSEKGAADETEDQLRAKGIEALVDPDGVGDDDRYEEARTRHQSDFTVGPRIEVENVNQLSRLFPKNLDRSRVIAAFASALDDSNVHVEGVISDVILFFTFLSERDVHRLDVVPETPGRIAIQDASEPV